MNYFFLSTGSGCIEILIREDDIQNMTTSGSNDLAVANTHNEDYIKLQLKQIPDEIIDEEFDNLGIDMTVEEKDKLKREDKEDYLLWSLAWNFVDDEEDSKEPYTEEEALEILSKLS